MTTQTTATTAAATASTVTDFEFFEGGISVNSTRPQITLRRGGVIVITRAVAVMLGDAFTHIQLAYNPKTRAIGLKAATASTPGAYLLRPQTKGPNRLIGGKRFFAHHGLEVDKASTHEATDFGNGIVGFILPGPAAPAAPAAANAAAENSSTPKAEKPRKTA